MTKASNAETSSPVGATSVATTHESCASTLPRNSARSLWLWVAAGFLFLALLWTAMFTAARSADTRTVPLATQGGRP